jgi:hypothetical protein
MELVAGEVEAFHRGFSYLDAFAVTARIECAFDLETGLGRRCSDQLDDG